MKNFHILFALAALSSLLMASCSAGTIPAQRSAPAPAPAEPATTLVLTDGLGRQVTLPSSPKKIVSLAPSNTEILFTLGAESQLIGRDDFSDFPEQAKKLPSVGGLQSYNLEELSKLQPDLVLAAGINTPEQVKSIEDLKLTVFYVPNPKSFEDLYNNLETVGKMTGREQEAKAVIENMQKDVEKVQSAVKDISARPKVFYELDATEPAKPWTAGPGTFVNLLIKMAGGENVGEKLAGEWAQISQEELIVQNPDLVLLGDAQFGVTVDQVVSRPGWKDIKAVQENRVMPFDDNIVSRPGPRLSQGLVELAKVIHPELADRFK
jgi:iron complex transport system substrate-binding protein